MHNWFSSIKSKLSSAKEQLAPTEDESQEIIAPAIPALVLPGTVILLTKGKWVTYQGRIGVVADLDSSGYATVHLTDAIGETVDQLRTAAGNLVLARLAEIPAPRRPTNPARAAVLGYV